MELLALIIITSLAIFGFHYALQFDLIQDEFGKPMIINKQALWWIKWAMHKALNKTKAKFLLQALCNCVVCMGSVYGIISYIAFAPNKTIMGCAIVVAAVAGLNRLLISIVQR